MTATIQTILLLLAVLVVVAIVARRLNTAPSILLVIAGIGLALAPGLPRIELAPELVLLGILPPLIYSAGVAPHTVERTCAIVRHNDNRRLGGCSSDRRYWLKDAQILTVRPRPPYLPLQFGPRR